MESIGKNCTPLKHEYDNCFNKWYTEKFLHGDTTPECDEIFHKYRQCVMVAIKEKNIDKMLAQAQTEIGVSFDNYANNNNSSSSSTSSSSS